MILMNLFSVFDPSSYYGFSFNWLIMMLVLLFIPLKFYLMSSSIHSSFSMMLLKVSDMFSEISGVNRLGIVFVVVCTFLYLVFSNLLGLFPFIFTSTSHPMITMGAGLVYWVSFFLMGWIKSLKESAAHLVPEGSPFFLSPVMVMIESISHLMRPFTLSIRLAANMMAGHLIISLLASISTVGMVGFFCSYLFQGVLLILEVGVSIIQGFVFSILLLLYSLEYY